MASTMEMKAFEEQINLSLLSDIIAFVVDTIKADYTQKENLRRRCILLNYDVKSEDFQKKYGFLYLGELLERHCAGVGVYQGRYNERNVCRQSAKRLFAGSTAARG